MTPPVADDERPDSTGSSSGMRLYLIVPFMLVLYMEKNLLVFKVSQSRVNLIVISHYSLNLQVYEDLHFLLTNLIC